jgi:ribosome biogenesis GTPase
VILTKADLCEHQKEAVAEIERVAPFVPAHVVSALDGTGLNSLSAYLGPGQTSVLLGSSGVGKSTLVNRILGEERQEVRDVRSHDDRGRHTTTSRQLLFLPTGGMMIDTPGLREVQLWVADDGLGQTFREVEEAAALCRFTNCGHHAGTPGCGVQAAIENGRRSRWPTRSVTTRREYSSNDAVTYRCDPCPCVGVRRLRERCVHARRHESRHLTRTSFDVASVIT